MDGIDNALQARSLTVLPEDPGRRSKKRRNPQPAPIPAPAPAPTSAPPPGLASAEVTIPVRTLSPSPPIASTPPPIVTAAPSVLPAAPPSAPTRPAGSAPPASSDVPRPPHESRDQVREELAASLEACAREVQRRASAELALDHARADVASLQAESDRLRGLLVAAHRQAEQWAERARQAESNLQTIVYESDAAADEASRLIDETTQALANADEQARGLTEQSAAFERVGQQMRQTLAEQSAQLERVIGERDAAQRRCAELESELEQLLGRRFGTAGQTDLPAPATVTAPSPRALPAETLSAPTRHHVVTLPPSEPEHPVSLAADIRLDPWHLEALAAWTSAGYRGVVEAVTEEGNRRLACWAMGQAVDIGMKVLVLTSSVDQVDEWHARLRSAFPINRVGVHSSRGKGRGGSFDVVIAPIDALAKQPVLSADAGVLVVADDVNAFANPVGARALASYAWRLGLTTAYERDEAAATYLDPCLGGLRFQLDLDRALADGLFAPFHLAIAAVQLSDAEQAEYDACAKVAAAGDATSKAARKAAARCEAILAATTARDSILRTVASTLRESGRAIVTAPSTQAAEHGIQILAGQGCAARPLGSTKNARRRGGAEAQHHDVDLFVTPRDASDTEGSTAGLAVMMYPPGHRKQMMERVDRVIGARGDLDVVRLVVVYVEGTAEADRVADGTPVAAIARQASRLSRVSARDTDGLLDFLRLPAPAAATMSATIPRSVFAPNV